MDTKRLVKIVGTGLCATLLLAAPAAYASHPLDTEAPETVAPLAVEAEVSYELAHNPGGEAGNEGEVSLWVATGVVKGVDIGVVVPYVMVNPDEGKKESGVGDVELEAKWNLLEERESVPALALKAAVTFPTGDDKKGLGSGGNDVTAAVLATKSFGPLGFDLHLGYTRLGKVAAAEESADGETEKPNKNLFAASLAARWSVIEHLALVAAVRYESPEAKGAAAAVSAVVGAKWRITDNVGIDLGGRFGLTDTAPDWTLLASLNFAFGKAEGAAEGEGHGK